MATFCEYTPLPKTRFDRRSFRTIFRGKTRLIIGCPKGSWQSRKERCKVGTKAHKIITPAKKGKRCKFNAVIIMKGGRK